uniref:Uncharacterized protein n=1 Tax=Trichobilharzia regenti TaxID=157069 RepID=A0AA85J5J4_TRIRE|nr:unnamed protein product [Trichobilharzia regenti]
MTQPAGHQHLNPLPEENQMNQGDNAPGYVDSGIQTADINGGGGTATDAGGSPGAGGGGSHRHHRRRRRKQSQQQQQQERQTGDMSGGGGSEAIHDSNIQDNGGGAGGGGMERLQNQSQSIRDSQMDLGLQKRQHALSSPGPYSDTDPMLSGQSNIPGLHSYPHNANGSMEPPPMSRYIRYDSPQRAPSVLAVAAMAFASNMNNNPDHNSMTPYQQHHFNPDSLSRHIGGGNGPSGGNYHPTTGSGSGTGLLVGPPPRIRDYSEYGIPRGIGLPPTPTVGAGGGGGQPQSLPQHNVLMSSPPLPPSGGAAAAVPSGVGGSMYYDGGGGHYHREGQA